MLSVTPTKLNDYLTCPLKFKLRHIEKAGGGFSSSAAFSFGTSMHSALEELHKGESLPPTPIDSEKLLNRFWDKAAYSTGEEERSYFIKGCRALEGYCETAKNASDKTLGTEVHMSFVIDFKGLKIRLGCKSDRLALGAGNVLEIIDYKTNRSGKVPTAEFLRYDLPTFLYYVLTRLSYPQYPHLKVTFLNVLTMAKVSIEYEKSLVDENKQALWKCLKIIAGGDYPPRTSESCCWCDFQDDCPAANKIADFSTV